MKIQGYPSAGSSQSDQLVIDVTTGADITYVDLPDGIRRLIVNVTTGGTGGEEQISINDPTLDSNGYNMLAAGAVVLLYLQTQTDGGDFVTVDQTTGLNAGYAFPIYQRPLTVNTPMAKKIKAKLDFQGAGVCYQWNMGYYEINSDYTGINFTEITDAQQGDIYIKAVDAVGAGAGNDIFIYSGAGAGVSAGGNLWLSAGTDEGGTQGDGARLRLTGTDPVNGGGIQLQTAIPTGTGKDVDNFNGGNLDLLCGGGGLVGGFAGAFNLSGGPTGSNGNLSSINQSFNNLLIGAEGADGLQITVSASNKYNVLGLPVASGVAGDLYNSAGTVKIS